MGVDKAKESDQDSWRVDAEMFWALATKLSEEDFMEMGYDGDREGTCARKTCQVMPRAQSLRLTLTLFDAFAPAPRGSVPAERLSKNSATQNSLLGGVEHGAEERCMASGNDGSRVTR